MKFVHRQWPGGPQEVAGRRLSVRKEGGFHVLDASPKFRTALVALGWRGAAVGAPTAASAPATATRPPAPARSASAGRTAAAAVLRSNARTVCRAVRAGTHDAMLAELLDAEKADDTPRSTVVSALENRIEEVGE